MQAQQCVQLSITNHPFDLILLLSYSIYTYFLLYADISEPAAVKTAVRRARLPLRGGGQTGHRAGGPAEVLLTSSTLLTQSSEELACHEGLRKRGTFRTLIRTLCSASGDHSAVEPPVPIPNTEVKRRSADGSLTTGHARVGRCQVIPARLP